MDKYVGDLKKLYVFRVDTGHDLLEELQRAVREAGIRTGVILTGMGSLVTYHVHVVGEKRHPVPNVYFHGSGGFDLLAAQGYVIDGRVHAHITVSNETETMGGHLEPGCEVYTFAIITVAELEGTSLTGVDSVRRPG